MELTWRKSTFSSGGNNGECVEVAWPKSSYGNDTSGACAEAHRLPPTPLPIPHSPDLRSLGSRSPGLLSAVRDSKNPAATLTFPTTPWRAFLTSLTDHRRQPR